MDIKKNDGSFNHRLTGWSDVTALYKSEYFKSSASDIKAENEYMKPSEKLIYTQSNARILLGQDPKGRITHLAHSTEIYPIPTDEMGYYVGMYYQSNMVIFLGSLSYYIETEDGAGFKEIINEDTIENETYYAGHFLPVTYSKCDEYEVKIFSFAPFDGTSFSDNDAGIFYVMNIANISGKPIKGRIRLKVIDLLTDHYEFSTPFTNFDFQSQKTIRKSTLIISKPQGSMGIFLKNEKNGKWIREEGVDYAEFPINIPAGGEYTAETVVVLADQYKEILPRLYKMGIYDSFTALNNTVSFWKNRLGILTTGDFNDSLNARISKDVFIRGIVDDFNCIQVNADGNLTAMYQGAPSHQPGTLWGIDVEPTAISIMHICPELGRVVMEFFMTHSQAPKSIYDRSEHSVPILVSPVMLARKYLELTGDIGLFDINGNVMKALESIMDDIDRLKHPEFYLLPSRFSSDGKVFRRYDHGTNVKAWYTVDSYAYILEYIGFSDKAKYWHIFKDKIKKSIDDKMLIEGPFGIQISGGTNLGEDHGDFYMAEGIPYYDGEDTGSVLAPVYGIYDYNYEPWVNYHRFARSLWCSNFDPEYGADRWFQWGGPLDGTAYVARMGSGVTRKELIESAEILLKESCDEASGSIYWWPYGLNHKRSLTRCSQGQGTWVWFYLQQWLGIKIDVCEKKLTIAPRSFLTEYKWENAVLGNARFNISWVENKEESIVTVENLNDDDWKIETRFRPFGIGAEICDKTVIRHLNSGETLYLRNNVIEIKDKLIKDISITGVEADEFGGDNGIVFNTYNIIPQTNSVTAPDASQKSTKERLTLINTVIVNNTGEDWSDFTVNVQAPEGSTVCEKPYKLWIIPSEDDLHSNKITIKVKNLLNGQRTVVSFWLRADTKRKTLEARYNKHAFDKYTDQKDLERILMITLSGIDKNEKKTDIKTLFAELKASTSDGKKYTKNLQLPIKFEVI